MSYIGSTPTTQSFIAGTDYFNGNGSTVNFTLSRSVNSVNDIEVIVNNVEQIPSGYSVSGTTLTFSVAPSSGTSNVYVRYLSTTNLSLAIPSGTSATFNTVTVADGSATTPSITNDGDTNTGIFFPAADTIGFSEGGAEAARFDASGNLCVGSTAAGNPATKSVSVGLAGTTTGGIQLWSPTTSAHSVQWGDGTSSTDPYRGYIEYDHASDSMRFATSSTERARIDSSGNVMVATTSAAGKLNVAGQVTATGGFFKANGAPSLSAATAGEAMLAPDGGSGALLYGQGTNYDVAICQRSTAVALAVLAGTTNVYAPGNLLVGTTSTSTSSPGVLIRNVGGDNGQITVIKTQSGTLDCIENYHSGSYVGGLTYSNTATALVTSSDKRLKTNIKTSSSAMGIIEQVQVVSHDWINDSSSVRFGLIAQELNNVFPEAVRVGNNGEEIQKVWGVDYARLVPVILKAIQEQQALITALTTRITALENNNATQ